MTELDQIKLNVSNLILGSLNQLLKSTLVIVLMYVLGFASGFVYVASRVHYYALKNDKYQVISELESKLEEQRKIDNEIDQSIRELKTKVSHDLYSICINPIGKKIVEH